MARRAEQKAVRRDLIAQLQIEALHFRESSMRSRVGSATRFAHARMFELLTDAIRYMSDRDMALAERVRANALLMTKLESRAARSRARG